MLRKLGTLAVALGVCSTLTHDATGATPFARFQSGPERVGLVELFSSEGCSSCPAADGWFTQVEKAPGLWTEFVPVVWHVDYWDGLGWKDPYALPAATTRQRAYASQWGVRSIYTPCVVLSGQETREWRIRRSPSRPEGQPGSLIAECVGTNVVVTLERGADRLPDSLEAHAAMLAFERTSDVTAGENRGKRLRHDFLATAWIHRRMRSDGQGWSAVLSLPPRPSGRHALAVWVSTPGGSPEPLQATGGWLPEDAAP